MSWFGGKTEEPLLDDGIDSFSEGSSEVEGDGCGKCLRCSCCPDPIVAYKWGLTVLSIFLAPLSMFLATKECGFHVFLSIFLYILGFVGAVVHALIVIWMTKTVERNYKRKPTTG